MSDAIKNEIKSLIVEKLELEGVKIEDIKDEMPLFESDLALDSIDILELVVEIEKRYHIKIKNSEQAKHAMRTVNTLAAFVVEQQKLQAL